MWFTWGVAILILATWATKMIAEKAFRIQRTPLDILLLLFMLSQVIATIFSLDQRISWWGYYSRFNGGLLSLLTYYALYYAFVSNLGKKEAFRTLIISLFSGLVVALWGLPSHFGYDPTCLMFRGTFDVSCWTEAFKPTIRIFSTLGQPAWMAAYLAILLPITMAFFLSNVTQKVTQPQASKRSFFLPLGLFFLALLFYLDLTFTNTRAGFLGFWIANGFFWGVLALTKSLSRSHFFRSLALFNISFLILAFFFGTTFPQLDKYTFPNLLAAQSSPSSQASTPSAQTPAAPSDMGGTDSGQIRLIVWKGAVDAWKANPLLGTGVETFAFAYYQHRPVEHNMTSEWDYLYNKAHNEYLNYLATTGAFGLITYLAGIGLVLFIGAKDISLKLRKATGSFDEDWVLSVGLLAGFGSILITNFFGFSVVIVNLYLFLIPAFFFILNNNLKKDRVLLLPRTITKTKHDNLSTSQWALMSGVWVVSIYLLFLLLRFWQADTAYALGSNLQRGGDVQGAYVQLANALRLRPTEPVFQDEYAINVATLGTALIQNNEATTGAQLAQEAISLSDTVVTNHPNNITFWKSRVRIFYSLAQVDPQYLTQALEAIQKAHALAPTDAKVMYNLGVLYGQNNDPQKAIEVLTKTIAIKPNYRDAYFARALFYRELATADGAATPSEDQRKANTDLTYILEKLNPYDEQAKKTLESWQ